MTEPSQCPQCGSPNYFTALPKCHGNQHPWHTPAPQPALRPPNEPLVPINDSYDENARMAAPQPAPKECICDEMGWVEDCPRHSGAQPSVPLSDEELVADDQWCPDCGDPREACLCGKAVPDRFHDPKRHAARTKLQMKFWAAMHKAGIKSEWEAQEKIKVNALAQLLGAPTPVREGAAFTAKEFEAELWTERDPQNKLAFAEAFSAHQNAALRQRITELENTLDMVTDDWQKLVDQYKAELAALRKERDALEETTRIQRKMLHYIAFVLTGDENGDPQLGADRAKAALESTKGG